MHISLHLVVLLFWVAIPRDDLTIAQPPWICEVLIAFFINGHMTAQQSTYQHAVCHYGHFFTVLKGICFKIRSETLLEILSAVESILVSLEIFNFHHSLHRYSLEVWVSKPLPKSRYDLSLLFDIRNSYYWPQLRVILIRKPGKIEHNPAAYRLPSSIFLHLSNYVRR